MASRLEHANLTCASIDEMLAFVQAAAPDWTVRGEDRPVAETRRWLHVGDDETYLALEEREPNSPSPHVTYEHHGLNHLGMVVDDMAALDARMEAGGYRRGAMWDNDVRLRHYWFDPDGNEWEFVEYLSDDPARMHSYDD